MNYLSYDHFFLVLGNTQRVRIIQLLIAQGPLDVSEITKKLQTEQSSISHDMKRLLMCHFVDVRKKGKERIYHVNKDTIKPLFALIDEHIKKNCVKGCIHWK